MLKMMIVGRRRGGMTVAQLHRYMVDVHGAMVVRAIGEQPGLTPQRYVQNHVFDGSFRAPGDAPDPFSVSLDFVTQVWFNDPAQAQAAIRAPIYLEQLQPDEDRFVDQTSVVKLPVAEDQSIGAAEPSGTAKLFVFHQRAEGVSVDDLAAATLRQWEPLLADAGNRIERLLRHRVLQHPAEPAGVDWVDEAWLADDSAARDLAGRWQALAGERRQPALFAPGSGWVLLARERVLFGGR